MAWQDMLIGVFKKIVFLTSDFVLQVALTTHSSPPYLAKMGSVCPSNPYRNPQYPGANLPAIFVEQFHIELGALLIPAFNRLLLSPGSSSQTIK